MVALKPSEMCDWKFAEAISSKNDLEAEGHYYAILGNEDGVLSGGYQWIASHNHKAYSDGAVLNITKCWAEYPSEMQFD